MCSQPSLVRIAMRALLTLSLVVGAFSFASDAFAGSSEEQFRLSAKGERIVTFSSAVPLKITARADLTAQQARQHCAKKAMGSQGVLVDMCLELEQLNPPKPSAGKGTVTRKVASNQIVGSTFVPNEGKVVVVVRSSIEVEVSITVSASENK